VTGPIPYLCSHPQLHAIRALIPKPINMKAMILFKQPTTMDMAYPIFVLRTYSAALATGKESVLLRDDSTGIEQKYIHAHLPVAWIPPRKFLDVWLGYLPFLIRRDYTA
jgi:hypothetical protein